MEQSPMLFLKQGLAARKSPHEMVTVLVGRDKTMFKRHRQVLLDYSHFFRLVFAYNGSRITHSENPFVFDMAVFDADLDPELYKCVEYWFDHNTIPRAFEMDIHTVIDLFHLVDFLKMPAMLNDVMKLLWMRIDSSFFPEMQELLDYTKSWNDSGTQLIFFLENGVLSSQQHRTCGARTCRHGQANVLGTYNCKLRAYRFPAHYTLEMARRHSKAMTKAGRLDRQHMNVNSVGFDSTVIQQYLEVVERDNADPGGPADESGDEANGYQYDDLLPEPLPTRWPGTVVSLNPSSRPLGSVGPVVPALRRSARIAARPARP